MKGRRGRPATRSRPALLFAAWRLVREEVAYRGAGSVAAACGAIILRIGRINVVSEDGELISVVMDADKLRQWYAQAELEREKDPGGDLARRCAVAHSAMQQAFSARTGSVARQVQARRNENAGLLPRGWGALSLEEQAALEVSENAADVQARTAAGSMPTPRRNRR